MTEFEKQLRDLAQNDLGSAIEMLLKEYGDGQTYFHVKTEEGLTILVHNKVDDQELLETMSDAEEVLKNAITEYEEIQLEEEDL